LEQGSESMLQIIFSLREFTKEKIVFKTTKKPPDEMCYCLDSYLGLGYDYISNNHYVNNEFPMNWIVIDTTVLFDSQKQYSCFHNLKVEYGCRYGAMPPDQLHN